MGAPGARSHRAEDMVLGVVCMLGGISFLAHLVVVATLPTVANAGDAAAFAAHQGTYIALALTAVATATFLIAFFGALGRMVAGNSPELATGAALAASVGILLIILGPVFYVGALMAAPQAVSGSAFQASATFEAAYWGSMVDTFGSVGQPPLGVGLVLLGWLGWRNRSLPRWLAIVSMAGGIAAFPATVAGSLAIVSLGAATVLSIAVGVILLGAPGRESLSKPAY